MVFNSFVLFIKRLLKRTDALGLGFIWRCGMLQSYMVAVMVRIYIVKVQNSNVPRDG